MPGIRYVGAVNSLPLSDQESLTFAYIPGFGLSKQMVEVRSVTPDYRKALGTPLLRGRDFTVADVNSKTLVAIVNQSFVKTYFHGRDPLGKEVRLGIGDFATARSNTVVGVVADVRHNKLEEAGQPQIFGPTHSGNNFAIQCDFPVGQVVNEARAVLHSLDPVLTLGNIHTMRERIETANARRRFQTSLLTGFASIAVALALVGLYGLMSYTVKQQRREIGVRLAVGSSRSRIITLILSQGLRLTGYGLLIGLVGAFALTRLISGWLFGVGAFDPITFIAVPLLVLTVACCACIIPAWSAARVDPAQALRQE